MTLLKKYWYIIVLIVITLLIWFASAVKPVQFNKLDLDPELTVRNKSQVLGIDTVVSIGLSELGITPKFVLIEDMEVLPNTSDLTELELIAYVVSDYQGGYIIYITNTSRMSLIVIISHELIHLEQYQSGMLFIRTDTVFFDDETYKSSDMSE